MSRYANLKKLGSGGFGEVHECRREKDGAIFAKKTLIGGDHEAQERFRREVRTLSKLDHPRIVKVVASGLIESPLWYVMPLFKRSLADEFPDIVGDADRIRKVFGAILEAMEYAHKQGVLHRDLKPGNVLLNSDDEVVVCDFGLGRSLAALTARITTTGDAFGTPGYLPPEQATDAKHVDARSDVFALGRILYELYTGDTPSAIQELSKLPPGVAAIVERCTQTDPGKRFCDAGELRTAMSNFWGIGDRKTNEGILKALIAKATAQGGLENSDVITMAQCIEALRDDTDFMHEVCIELPEPVIYALWAHNRHLIRHVVRLFADQVAAQGWGFDYVDRIGNACVRIWYATEDVKVRAAVAYAIVEVSVSHNRWRVMDQAAEMLQLGSASDLDLELATCLAPIAYHLSALRDRLNKAKLGPHLLSLLSKKDE